MKGITPRTAKQIVRHLNAPNFLAKGALLGAIGHRSSENGQPAGLVALPAQSWIGLLPDILGIPGTSSGTQGTGGVFSAMQNSEWQTRRSAVECTRALVISIGPVLEGAASMPAEVRLLLNYLSLGAWTHTHTHTHIHTHTQRERERRREIDREKRLIHLASRAGPLRPGVDL
jgi:hypothetical protein